MPYGEPLAIGDVTVSFHPAGHILGSAQIRMEHRGEVWVVSGDYKLAPDPTCAPFEPVRCHTFVTESTFGLPIFRWPAEPETVAAIHALVDRQSGGGEGQPAVRLSARQGAARCSRRSIQRSGPIIAHECGGTRTAASIASRASRCRRTGGAGDSRALVIAPPGLQGRRGRRASAPSPRHLSRAGCGSAGRAGAGRSTAASCFRITPTGRSCCSAIEETGAETVWVTHGYRAPLVRWLEEHGKTRASIAWRRRLPRRRGESNEGLRRTVRRARRDHQDQREGGRAAGIPAAAAPGGRRVGGQLPDRPPSQAAARIAQAGAMGHRRGGRSGLAVRRVLPRGRRFRRDHRAAAAAGRSIEPLPLHYWVEERLLPLRDADDETRRAWLRAGLARDGRAASASRGTS